MPATVEKYFPELTPWQLSQMSMLRDLYREWNEKINVISRKDISELYVRHVLHSMGIAKVIRFEKGTTVLDVGTGGGFPGIPLAILFPDVKFTLVDSIGKKIKVVQAVATDLKLDNVTAVHARAEDLKEKYHFVVSRAVTEFPAFYNWVKDKVARDQFNSLRNGILYLKGGDLDEELGRFAHKAVIYPLSDYFTEEFFETKKVVYYPVDHK